MDDEDDAPSSCDRSPSYSPPPPPPISIVHSSASLPPPSHHSSDSVTLATPAPIHQTLALALPFQPPPSSSSVGREDCWSDGSTSALIDAWGDRFLELERGNLKQKHWMEVADVVSSLNGYTKPPRSYAQCKNRIDSLKRRYKHEKSKISALNAIGLSPSSSWPFFNRLDLLLGSIIKTPPTTSTKHPSPAAMVTAGRGHFPQKQRTSIPMKRKRKTASPPQSLFSMSSTSDSLPPVKPTNWMKRRVGRPAIRELAQAIVKFGEVYERVESSKLQQTMEMEKQKMESARDLEMQRMQFFMKMQMEFSQLRSDLPHSCVRGGGGGGGSNNHFHRSRRRHHQSAGNININGTYG